MAKLDFKKQRSLRFHKNVRSKRGSRREIDLGSISRWNIVSAENDAALCGKVRNNPLPAGKIPCPNRRLDAAAINRALRRKYHIDRHHIHRPFEIPAKDAGEMIRRQDAAGAATDIKKLSVVGFSQAHSAAAE